MDRRSLAKAGFGLAAVLFLLAAFLPSLRGGTLNTAYLVIAVVFFVLLIVAGRKAAGPPT